MNRIDEEGMDLLAPLRDATPSERSGVDITKAKATGRRHNRRRTIAGMVTAASLVVVAGVGVPTVLDSRPDTTGPAWTAVEFDLFKQVVMAAPAGGFTPDTVKTYRDRQVISLRADNGQGTADITVYAPASAPTFPRVSANRAPDVNGREAYWIQVKDDLAIAWQWTDHTWATVTGENVPEPDVRNRIHQVAQSARPVDRPVRVPFKVASHDAFTLTSVQVDVYSASAMAVFTYASPDGGPQTISAGLLNARPEVTANDTIGGHPANSNPNGVKILDTGHGLSAFATTDAKNGALDLIRLVAATVVAADDPTDRATWFDTLLYN